MKEQKNIPSDARQFRINFLKNIYFFHEMPESSLGKIMDLCSEKEYAPESVLFFEDMPGDCFFIVLEGELEIWKRFGQVDGVLLGISGPGQPVGEMALIDDQPRSATVRARTALKALVIQAADFHELMLTDNNMCMTLLRSVTMMVRRSNESHISDLDRQKRELEKAYKELQAVQDELLSRERLSVVGKFSSLILHDIRNPLSAMKSRIALLSMNYGNHEYFAESIEKINGDIVRMEMLAAEFLDYARGNIRINLSTCSLNILFERFLDSISMKAERSNICIKIENSVQIPVLLDEERMLRVLINAGENACKAMPDGGNLTVSAVFQKGMLILTISDTGCGMSGEVLKHIFEPFYTSSPSGGTGLGLIIIKSIVEAHNGSVSVNSAEGKGTTLRITLPVPS